MKKVQLKPLRLTRQPIRVLTHQDLVRVEGGWPPSENCPTTKPTGVSEAAHDTCG